MTEGQLIQEVLLRDRVDNLNLGTEWAQSGHRLVTGDLQPENKKI